MEGFKEGYDFASRTSSFHYSVALSEDYVASVDQEISELMKNLVELAQTNQNKDNKRLGGDIAEI